MLEMVLAFGLGGIVIFLGAIVNAMTRIHTQLYKLNLTLLEIRKDQKLSTDKPKTTVWR